MPRTRFKRCPYASQKILSKKEHERQTQAAKQEGV
jgi:hypothetical protein